jgi:hypothetical protein
MLLNSVLFVYILIVKKEQFYTVKQNCFSFSTLSCQGHMYPLMPHIEKVFCDFAKLKKIDKGILHLLVRTLCKQTF